MTTDNTKIDFLSVSPEINAQAGHKLGFAIDRLHYSYSEGFEAIAHSAVDGVITGISDNSLTLDISGQEHSLPLTHSENQNDILTSLGPSFAITSQAPLEVETDPRYPPPLKPEQIDAPRLELADHDTLKALAGVVSAYRSEHS